MLLVSFYKSAPCYIYCNSFSCTSRLNISFCPDFGNNPFLILSCFLEVLLTSETRGNTFWGGLGSLKLFFSAGFLACIKKTWQNTEEQHAWCGHLRVGSKYAPSWSCSCETVSECQDSFVFPVVVQGQWPRLKQWEAETCKVLHRSAAASFPSCFVSEFSMTDRETMSLITKADKYTYLH